MISLALGIVSVITLGIGTFTDLDPFILASAVLALAGLFLGLTLLARRQHRISAWTGVACSGIALVAAAIVYGIGHGLG